MISSTNCINSSRLANSFCFAPEMGENETICSTSFTQHRFSFIRFRIPLVPQTLEIELYNIVYLQTKCPPVLSDLKSVYRRTYKIYIKYVYVTVMNGTSNEDILFAIALQKIDCNTGTWFNFRDYFGVKSCNLYGAEQFRCIVYGIGAAVKHILAIGRLSNINGHCSA